MMTRLKLTEKLFAALYYDQNDHNLKSDYTRPK